MAAEKRYATVNGEATALYIFGKQGGRASSNLVYLVALPWEAAQHSGSWDRFDVATMDAGMLSVRMTLVPDTALRGMRKAPLRSWKGFRDFPDGFPVSVQALEQAYEGATGALETSAVEEVAVGEGDMEVETPAVPDTPLRPLPVRSEPGAEDSPAGASVRSRSPAPTTPRPSRARTPMGSAVSALRGDPAPGTPAAAAGGPPGIRTPPRAGEAEAISPMVSGIPLVASSGEEMPGTALEGITQVMQTLARAQQVSEERTTKVLDDERQLHRQFEKWVEESWIGMRDRLDHLEKGFVESGQAREKESQAMQGQLSAVGEQLKVLVDRANDEAVIPEVRELDPQRGCFRARDFDSPPDFRRARKVTWAQPPVRAEVPPVSKTSTSSVEGALLQLAKVNEALLGRLNSAGDLLGSSDGALGDLSLGGVRSAKEREVFKRRMVERPVEVAKEWWDAARVECGVEPGMPFSARLFGETTLRFEGHTALHRAFLMEAEVHRLLWAGEPERALAQNVQNLRALATCLHQGGTWKGAWELTYLPDPGRQEGGVTLPERAAVSRFMREQAAVDRIVEEARDLEKKRTSGRGTGAAGT